MTSRFLFTLWVASLLLLCSTPLSSGLSSREYDHYFQEYGKRILPIYRWQWFKAQGYQESLLVPDAVSPAGAQGIMQIMPGTWRDLSEELGVTASPRNPKVNIFFGIYYMKKMVKFWRAPRSDIERLELAQASYNAGPGNILAAQIKCQNKPSWNGISPCLSKVTGKKSKETLGYVEKIKRWYRELVS